MKENLAIKILNDKINEYITYVNKYGNRNFDCKRDKVYFSLTPRQFQVVKKQFKLKEIYSVYGLKFDDFQFNDYTIHMRYSDRMNCYEFTAQRG